LYLSIQEIKELKERAEIQKNRNIIYIFIVVLTLIIASFSTYCMIKRSKEHREIQDKNEEIISQKKPLEKALVEKETLLREVNHRVNNNLQIISSLLLLQSKKVEDPASKAAIRESQQRVQTMSLIHQKLYLEEHFENIDFQVYLEDLVKQIISSYKTGKQSIKLIIRNSDTQILVDQAVPLSLIIHELVTNSLKHAFKTLEKGSITIKLYKKGITGVLEYADDGTGIGNFEEVKNNGHIGLKVIELLVGQLQGELEIVEKAPFSVRIIFDLQ